MPLEATQDGRLVFSTEGAKALGGSWSWLNDQREDGSLGSSRVAALAALIGSQAPLLNRWLRTLVVLCPLEVRC